MKLLRDLVLIELEEAVVEKKTNSGIILLEANTDRYQINDDESLVQDLINRPKTNKGKLLSKGRWVDRFEIGDTLIYRKDTETHIIEVDGKSCAIVKNDNILCSVKDGVFIPNEHYVLVEISKAARESLFSRKVVTDAGEVVTLFIADDKQGTATAESDSSKFVNCGNVLSAGSGVIGVVPGDLALISYICDNDQTVIVGYKGENKIIAVRGVTSRHKNTKVVKGEKGREQIAWREHDYIDMSDVYGVVRGNKVIAIEPFVFLEHESTTVMKVSKSGILHEEKEKILHRKVLSVSEQTQDLFRVKAGDTVVVDDFDIFDIEFSGRKVSCMNDVDIFLKKR
jgi:co-chaperonin GroES (HSP10)